MKSAISSGTWSSQIDTLVVNRNNITDPKTLSSHLASFFKTIIGSLREVLLRVSTYIIPVQTSLPPSFKLSQMEPEFVKKQLKSLKVKKINRHPRITSRTSKGWFRCNIWAPYLAYEQIFTWRLYTRWMEARPCYTHTQGWKEKCSI